MLIESRSVLIVILERGHTLRVVGKFQGYWGTLPRQSKLKYVCDPVDLDYDML